MMTPRTALAALERLVRRRRSTGPTILHASTWFHIEHRPERLRGSEVVVVFRNGYHPVYLGAGDADELGGALQTAGRRVIAERLRRGER